MKKFLLAISIASLFTACNTEAKKEQAFQTTMVPVNTAGYAVSNASTDVGISKEQEDYVAPVSKKTTIRRNRTAVNTAPVTQQSQQPVVTAPASNTTIPETTAPATIPSTAGLPSTNGTGETTSTGAAKDEEKTTKKKGWSDAAKGAVIGGAAGAIGGAIINGKNRTVGAVVGAVIGAAGGYAIGRKRDNNKNASDYSMVVN